MSSSAEKAWRHFNLILSIFLKIHNLSLLFPNVPIKSCIALDFIAPQQIFVIFCHWDFKLLFTPILIYYLNVIKYSVRIWWTRSNSGTRDARSCWWNLDKLLGQMSPRQLCDKNLENLSQQLDAGFQEMLQISQILISVFTSLGWNMFSVCRQCSNMIENISLLENLFENPDLESVLHSWLSCYPPVIVNVVIFVW